MRSLQIVCVILLMASSSIAMRDFTLRGFMQLATRDLDPVITGEDGGVVPEDGAGGVNEPILADETNCDGTKPAACRTCFSIDYCLGETPTSSGTAIECPEDTPYCAKSPGGDYCSAVEFCTPVFDSIKCTGAGIYPDPYQCRFFHRCTEANEMSETAACDLGYVFSPTAATNCVKASSSNCINITCDSNKVWSRYGNSNVYYGRCYDFEDTDVVPPKIVTKVDIYKCSAGSTFDGNVCKFVCPKEGKFPDTNFPDRYFDCYRLATGGYAYSFGSCAPPTKLVNGKCVF